MIKIGLIGAGKRSHMIFLAKELSYPYQIIGISDPNKNSTRLFQEKSEIPVREYEDYHHLLNDPEINTVFIYSPDALHHEHAIAALKAGKHVYLEKPMAISTEDCDEILEVAAEHQGIFFVGHNMRKFRVMMKMKEIIHEGLIGEVKSIWCRHFISYGGDAYFKDWHAERRLTTGLLLQKGAHDIDIIHWLASAHSLHVSAIGGLTLYGENPRREAEAPPIDRADCSIDHWPPLAQSDFNPVIDVEDLNMVIMKLNNGVLASYQQCHYSPDAWRNYTVIGTKGRIENIGDLPGNAKVALWNRRTDAFSPPDQEWSFPHEAGSHGGSDLLILAEFFNSIINGSAPAISPLEARNAVATACAATDSVRNRGASIEIPPFFVKNKCE